MSFPFKFHKPKCMIYLFLSIILRTINYKLIRKNITSDFFTSVVFTFFLKSIVNTFAIFIYLYQKYYIEKSTYKLNVDIEMNDIKYYEFIPIIICSVFSYFLSNISYYSHFYSYQMQKMELELISDLELIIFFISHVLNEKYFLNSKHYIHHYLSLSIIILFLIIILIVELFKNFQVSFISFIFIILIALESQYLFSINYVIVKILNYQYFFNISLFLFILGIFGILTLLIFDFFYVFIFHYDSKFIFKIGEINSETLVKDIILLIIYRMNIFLRDFFNLKIVEESKPSYTMISYALYHLIIFIIDREFELNISNIIYIIIFLFFCIYLEIIILKFCNLDKNTNLEISYRGEKDTIKEIIMSFDDTNSIISF